MWVCEQGSHLGRLDEKENSNNMKLKFLKISCFAFFIPQLLFFLRRHTFILFQSFLFSSLVVMCIEYGICKKKRLANDLLYLRSPMSYIQFECWRRWVPQGKKSEKNVTMSEMMYVM